MDAAGTLINRVSIVEVKCSCFYKTRSNLCDSFNYFNPTIREYSIYEIGNIRAKKIRLLFDNNEHSILDLPLGFALNENQQTQVVFVKQEKPIINKTAIEKELNKLKFPLHFIDYEDYASVIPKLDGMSQHKHLTFQESIHTLSEDSTLTHFEYLLDEMQIPRDMIEASQKFTASIGMFVSWYASFEISRNKDLIN